jgi:hypothetical protein
MRRLVILPCLLAISFVALAGCNPDKSTTNNTPAATSAGTQAIPTAANSGSPSPTALLSVSTPEPVDASFARDPISVPAVATTNISLILAEAGTPDVDPGTPAYDRMSFQFDGDMPAYEIKYVPGPVLGCASGQDAQVTGQAFLQIRFSPAVSHDDQGNPTVSPTDTQPGLPIIQQAKQTCDSEGVVIWTLGVSSEVDYRALVVGGQILVVDLKHP